MLISISFGHLSSEGFHKRDGSIHDNHATYERDHARSGNAEHNKRT